MSTEIESAIKLLAAKIKDSTTPDEALKYTQAALNMAHTAATIEGIEHMKKQ